MAIAQTGVLNPQDPIVIYDPSHPPAVPPAGTLAKWVKTTSLAWNTDAFKCYYYKGIAFRLKFPAGYRAATNGTTYPLFVFFHGAGEAGSAFDNETQLHLGGQLHANAVDSGRFSGFLLYPQTPGGYWDNGQIDILARLITQYLVPQLGIDSNRIIVSGLSAGGSGAWQFAIAHPRLTAACIPMSAASLGDESTNPDLLNVPIWLFQGALDTAPDPGTTQQVVSFYRAHGASLTFTLYPDLGHGTWDRAWQEPGYFPFLSKAHK
jgi:predicted esterase